MLEAIGAATIFTLVLFVFVAIILGVLYLVLQIENEYIAIACILGFLLLLFWAVMFVAFLLQGA